MKSFWKHFFIDNGDVALIEAGLQKFVPNQVNNYTVKHDIVFHIVNAGKGIYTVNNNTYQLEKNDGFILKKGRQVFYQPDDINPWTISWIGIGGQNLSGYLQHSTIPSVDTVTFGPNSIVREEMNQLIHFLFQNNPKESLEYLQAFSKLYRLLYSINREFPLNPQQNQSHTLMEPSLADNIYEYIYENFLHEITVTGIAEHFDISRNYLFKLCKEYFGQSPKQIIQELRMNQASQLLRGTQMHIKEIANMIGYKDAFSFSKMFKEYFNYSPSEFRKLSDIDLEKALFIRHKFLEKRASE